MSPEEQEEHGAVREAYDRLAGLMIQHIKSLRDGTFGGAHISASYQMRHNLRVFLYMLKLKNGLELLTKVLENLRSEPPPGVWIREHHVDRLLPPISEFYVFAPGSPEP